MLEGLRIAAIAASFISSEVQFRRHYQAVKVSQKADTYNSFKD